MRDVVTGSGVQSTRQYEFAGAGEKAAAHVDYDLLDSCNVVLARPDTDAETRKQVIALRAQLLAEAHLPDTSPYAQEVGPWAGVGTFGPASLAGASVQPTLVDDMASVPKGWFQVVSTQA